MTNKEIFETLRAAGMTVEGACGTIANMAAEGVMSSINVEDRADAVGISDADYTAKVDSDPTYDFETDNGKQYGYGLCQWTERSRKAKLRAFARSRGVSIGDRRMQVDFTILEMQTDFPSVWQVVTTSHDLLQCTQIVLNVYENPAVKNLGTRMEYAEAAMAYFTDKAATDVPAAAAASAGCQANTVKPVVMAMQMIMCYAGYWLQEADGMASPDFYAAARTLLDDLERGESDGCV